MKINKYISKTFLGTSLMLALGMSSCTNDFEETNKNDKYIYFEDTKPENFIIRAQWDLAYELGDFTAPFILSQQVAEGTYARISTNLLEINDGDWEDVYRGLSVIQDAERSLEQWIANNPSLAADEASINAYKGVITTLKVINWQIITDSYGAIPFEEALDFDNFTPKYNTQKEIYSALLKDISAAVAMLKDNDGGAFTELSTDRYYGGDLTKWYRLANSVKLRVATRVLDTDLASDAKIAIAEAFAAGTLQADDNARFEFTDSDRNPIFEALASRRDYLVSDVLVDRLSAINDPRLEKFASQAWQIDENGDWYQAWVGATYGAKNTQSWWFYTRFPQRLPDNQTQSGVIFDYSESEFLLAEAATRGIIKSDAKTHYDNAVKGSIMSWGVEDEEAINTYLAQESVAFDATSEEASIKSIAMQKWISLYTNGSEAYAELRRLDYPEVVEPAIKNGKYPVRLIYPSDERAVNAANYASAVQTTLGGNDKQDVKLWWDKK